MIKTISNGTAGEQVAEMFFKQHGWSMFRHQPPTKVVRSKGKVFTIQCKSNGIADYTGFQMIDTLHGHRPIYRACEVKEAHGRSMPASRLGEDQRDWMNALPKECAWIGICWMDNPVTFELFSFVYSGGYKRGKSIWSMILS